MFRILSETYDSIFNIKEIEENKLLQYIFWISWSIFLIDFIPRSQPQGGFAEGSSIVRPICWPHFQDCLSLHILQGLPESYRFSYYLVFMFSALIGAGWLAFQQKWRAAHFALMILFFEKLGFHFFLHMSGQANFNYYHLPTAFCLLFLSNKEVFIRMTFVTFYSFAASVKLTDSWILGSYFLHLEHGLALVPKYFIPVVTNAVILGEILFSWGLLARNTLIQRTSFVFWILFHLYSVTIVGFFYPLHCVPMVLILFRNGPGPVLLPQKKGRVYGYGFLILVIALHGYRFYFPHDVRFTQENYQYGLAMIDANRQCRLLYRALDAEENVLFERAQASTNAMYRCSPYTNWFHLRNICLRDPRVSRIEWTLDLSVDGSPFYRLVAEPNACSLTYSMFSRNHWIRTKEEAEIIGYPRPNQAGGRRFSRVPEPNSIVYPDFKPLDFNYLDLSSISKYLLAIYWLLWTGLFLFVIYRHITMIKLHHLAPWK